MALIHKANQAISELNITFAVDFQAKNFTDVFQFRAIRFHQLSADGSNAVGPIGVLSHSHLLGFRQRSGWFDQEVLASLEMLCCKVLIKRQFPVCLSRINSTSYSHKDQ